MKTLFSLLSLLLLTGCMSVGIQGMTPEQLKQTEGMLTCDSIKAGVGLYVVDGTTVVINIDALKKGATVHTIISVGPDCATTVETQGVR